MIVLGILFVILGIVMIWKPKLYWVLTEQWKGNAEEPSEIYVLLSKISGIIVCIVGLLISIGVILL